ncbi:MAG TPA: cytochrome b N-terminal domain-containing protein [Acidimicrobiia bacterium]|nr:cytochrome b N-terminal domain-containing protein [Acidimicrobiia bacterium]
MASRLGNWLDERTGWRGNWTAVFLRKIPRVNWAYTLGSATLFTLIIQVVTGILLTLYYVPEPQRAYASVTYITNEVPFGWMIRGLHHWGASAMVLLAVLHMVRVIIYGAYKYPREVTWITGVFLLLLTFAFGFTGYLLPWDQRAYWATVVGTRIAEVVPVIGGSIKDVLLGGPEISGLTLSRFFGAHVWVLPSVLFLLVGIHLYLVIRNGISTPPKRDE